jgi:hypothetical protein
MKNHNETTLKELLALFCSDIDIFLLQDEAQENDLDKMYSKEEIREQLHKTMRKFAKLPNIHPLVWNVPLFPALTDLAFLESGFSKREIEEAKKNAEELSKNN